MSYNRAYAVSPDRPAGDISLCFAAASPAHNDSMRSSLSLTKLTCLTELPTRLSYIDIDSPRTQSPLGAPAVYERPVVILVSLTLVVVALPATPFHQALAQWGLRWTSRLLSVTRGRMNTLWSHSRLSSPLAPGDLPATPSSKLRPPLLRPHSLALVPHFLSHLE
ncbi:hypothetical protein BJX70DRAFT_19282 [Aspergillus crustosus]